LTPVCKKSGPPGPTPAPTPAPTAGAGGWCKSFISPANFGFFTGRWTGRCRKNFQKPKCAVKHVAKDSDGKYIAGQRDGRWYKMLKFNGDGTRVVSSGRYKRQKSDPASPSELVSLYSGKGTRSARDFYQFKKGTAFSCEA